MEDKERRDIVDNYRDNKVNEKTDTWEDPQWEIYHITDRYGFMHKEKLPNKLTEYEIKTNKVENRRQQKWLKMLNNWNYFISDPIESKLQPRINKGIPDALRGEVWKRLLRVPRLLKEQEGKYQEMLEWGLKISDDIRQIDLDVNRTFRNHIMFRERYNTKQQMLFRILVAYSVYNSEVGYCQGMSQIAALLLMYLNEEDAFWALSTLMSGDKYAMHGFFIPGFPKLVRFSAHHDRIVKKLLPKVYKHFKKNDISSTLYTLKWFFQCFLDRVPFTLTLRLWDCYIYHGEVILTGMSYTLLRLHKSKILRKNLEELIEFLQVDLERDFGYHDDETINALFKSIQQLKQVDLVYPKDGPSPNEFPKKPFGFQVSVAQKRYPTLNIEVGSNNI